MHVRAAAYDGKPQASRLHIKECIGRTGQGGLLWGMNNWEADN